MIRKLWKLLLLFCVLAFAVVAFGDTSPSPLPPFPMPSHGFDWKIWTALLGPLVVAILDFVFALNKGAKSNGILHWLYLLAGGKETPPA